MMARRGPDLADIENDVRNLLVEQELAELATLAGDGHPSASTMHIAAEGLAVYLCTFTNTRKYLEMQDDSRVSYTASRLPPLGYEGRFETLTIQVKGHARLVTADDENAKAIVLSVEQFDWATPAKFNSVGKHQMFFRIDPIEAVWSDNRIGLMWRTVLEAAPDGSRFTAQREYTNGQV